MKKYFIALSILIFFVAKIFATAQVSDKLIYNGDTIFFLVEPLEKCFEDSIIYRNKLFEEQTEKWYSTACWRGYVAEWKIEDSTLYLTAIYQCHKNSIKADLKNLFGEKCVNGRVKAEWVSGNLFADYGKTLHYIHMGYQSIREFEIEFKIENGKILSTKKYENKVQKSIYTQNQKNLMEFISKNIQWESLPLDKLPVKVFVNIYRKENGKIECEVIRKSEYEEFNKEAIRVLKSLPEWDSLYRRGKYLKNSWTIPVSFVKK